MTRAQQKLLEQCLKARNIRAFEELAQREDLIRWSQTDTPPLPSFTDTRGKKSLFEVIKRELYSVLP